MRKNNEVYTITNIRLPKEDLKKLKREALEREQSVSALMRGLIRASLAGDSIKAPRRRPRHSVWDLPKLAQKTGDKKLSKKVDEIVYGG